MFCSKEIPPVVAVGKAPSPGSSAVSEKVRTRLEELDDLEEVRSHVNRRVCVCLCALLQVINTTDFN